MLQPAAITALLSQLINDANSNNSIHPHTALLTLLESSELYASATRLVDAPPGKSAVASILASTAAATGSAFTAPPPPTARPTLLSLDERVACLSAIATTSWREATEHKSKSETKGVVMPGASISVAKHGMTGMAGVEGTKEVVPLLLESDLGRILVMPIVPRVPTLSPSRGELTAMDETQDDSGSFGDRNKPFMLLTLNAASSPASATHYQAPSTPQQNHSTLSPALASSTATLSANNTTRSRLLSGVTTPTSTRSDHTPTPSRSPVSDHFPISSGVPQRSSSPTPAGSEADVAQSQANAAEQDARDAKIWSALYAQAKALARVLAPSLAECGVGQHDLDDHAETKQSVGVSDDEI